MRYAFDYTHKKPCTLLYGGPVRNSNEQDRSRERQFRHLQNLSEHTGYCQYFFIKHSDGVKNQPRAKNRSAKELAPETYSKTCYITQEPHSLCGSCVMTPFH